MSKFIFKTTDFYKIPCQPIAYWLNEKLLTVFSSNSQLNVYAEPRQGFATGNNDKFLRFWQEVDFEKLQISMSYEEAKNSLKKWFPCNKGGEFRKWFGNNYYIVNWENNGKEIKEFKGSVIRNPNYYFKAGGTWSTLSSGSFSMRFSPTGYLFESKGSVCFPKDDNDLFYVIGFLNSIVVKNLLLILSPTLDYHEGPVGRLPLVFNQKDKVKDIVDINIIVSKNDWYSFETSWDFKNHPLV